MEFHETTHTAWTSEDYAFEALKERLEHATRKLSSNLSQQHLYMLHKVIEHNVQIINKKIKTRHSQKLFNIGALQSNNDSYVNKDRWVLNLSNQQLSAHETELLSNGLNFTPTPSSIPVAKIVSNIESGTYNLPDHSKATIRAATVNILKNSKPQPTSNITRQQTTALQKLKQDPSITIVPADKGRAVVVMHTE